MRDGNDGIGAYQAIRHSSVLSPGSEEPSKLRGDTWGSSHGPE